MTSYLNRPRSNRPERKSTETSNHADFLANEGLIAHARLASRMSSQRESTYGHQRCTPRRSQISLVTTPVVPDQHDLQLQNSLVSSQASTVSSTGRGRLFGRSKLAQLFSKGSRNETEPIHDSFAGLKAVKTHPVRQVSKRSFGSSSWTSRVKGKDHSIQDDRSEPTNSAHTKQLFPPPDQFVHAPIFEFGAIPGAGYEKPGPRVNLSSGAAARAAAAAQNGLMENLRKLNIQDDHSVQDSESGVGIETGEIRTALVVPLVRQDPTLVLPPEVMFHVFSYLDALSVFSCELVSKRWNTMATDQHTWKRVFQSEFKPPDHRAYAHDPASDELAYSEVSWKSRWLIQKNLSQRWDTSLAGAFYLRGHIDNVYCVQFDDEKVVTGSKDQTIRIWSTRMRLCARILGNPDQPLSHEQHIGQDPLPHAFKPRALDVHYQPIRHPLSKERLPFAHEGSILCLQYDAEILVSGSSDSTLIIWHKVSRFDFRPVRHLKQHSKGVLDVCFDAENIVSCSKDHNICFWDRSNGRCIRKMTGHSGPVNAVKLQGDLIASASGDGLVKLWNRRSGLCIKEFTSSVRGLACVELSPDSRTIWAAGNDHDIYEFDANSGTLARTLGSHSNLVRSLHLDAGSGRLVSASYDGSIKVFDTRSGREIVRLRGWSGCWVLSAKADYRRIVATTQSGRAIIIDFGYLLKNVWALDPGSANRSEFGDLESTSLDLDIRHDVAR